MGGVAGGAHICTGNHVASLVVVHRRAPSIRDAYALVGGCAGIGAEEDDISSMFILPRCIGCNCGSVVADDRAVAEGSVSVLAFTTSLLGDCSTTSVEL
jgi:hypothetical protein